MDIVLWRLRFSLTQVVRIGNAQVLGTVKRQREIGATQTEAEIESGRRDQGKKIKGCIYYEDDDKFNDKHMRIN
jgi:hypothetical protein